MPPSRLRRVQITHIRNVRQARLDKLGLVNVLYGANGSGKTSILEAIHMLGMARSFRGNPRALITHGETSCTVYGQLDPGSTGIGVHREASGELRVKLAGRPLHAIAELVDTLPVQSITADSFDLLNGAPGGRRRFLDWGVFHVEHAFYSHWKRYQRGIKQRNILLRRGKMEDSQLPVWTREIAESGEALTGYREHYFARLAEAFTRCIERLAPSLQGMDLRFRRGWDRQLSFEEALKNSLPSDIEQGFTHIGPQRADIKVLIEGRPAAEVLSRGQQKLVVCGLKLAQSAIMAEVAERNCIYLVDDLPAELDQQHATRVCEFLAELDNGQIFITTIDKGDIERVWPAAWQKKLNMFHVEHGVITNT